MFGFCSVCLFVLFNPFITIWAGADRLLTMQQVFFIVLNFYLVGMRNVNLTFRDTMGVFKEGRFVPIISAIVNIGVSILTASRWGLIGAFVGTTVSMITTLVWMEPVILFKYGFKRSVWPYFGKYLLYFASTVLATIVTWFIANILPASFIGFIGKMIVCLIAPNGIFLLLYGRTKEFREVYQRVISVVLKKFKKKEVHA